MICVSWGSKSMDSNSDRRVLVIEMRNLSYTNISRVSCAGRRRLFEYSSFRGSSLSVFIGLSQITRLI